MEELKNIAFRAPLYMVVHFWPSDGAWTTGQKIHCAGRHVMPHYIESTNGIAEAVVMQSRREFIMWARIAVEGGVLVAGPRSVDRERTDRVRCNLSLRRREGRQGECGKGCKSRSSRCRFLPPSHGYSNSTFISPDYNSKIVVPAIPISSAMR